MERQPDAGIPRWLARGAALAWRFLLIVAALVVLGAAFIRLRLVVVPIVAALFLSSVLVPPTQWLRRHRVPPLLATWMVFLAGVGIIAGVVLLLIPSVTHEFQALGKELLHAIDDFKSWLITGPLHLTHQQVDDYVTKAQNELSSNGSNLFQGALSGLTLVAQWLGVALLTIVLTFFFVKDGEMISRWFLSLAAPEKADDMRALGRQTWATLGGYVRGTAFNGLLNAAVLSIGLSILGVPLVVPIALLTFVGGFLPLVGGILSGALAIVVTLVSRGGVPALIVFGLTVLIHNLEGYLVGPLVLGRAVKLHPIAVLLSLTIGTILAGIIGAFLAVPVCAISLEVNEFYRVRRARLAEAIAGGPIVLARPDEPPRADDTVA